MTKNCFSCSLFSNKLLCCLTRSSNPRSFSSCSLSFTYAKSLASLGISSDLILGFCVRNTQVGSRFALEAFATLSSDRVGLLEAFSINKRSLSTCSVEGSMTTGTSMALLGCSFLAGGLSATGLSCLFSGGFCPNCFESSVTEGFYCYYCD